MKDEWRTKQYQVLEQILYQREKHAIQDNIRLFDKNEIWMVD